MLRILISLCLVCSLTTDVDAVEMKLERLDGSAHFLSDYRGKWIVVNYWATWCPPCIEEMPELQNFHDKYVDQGAVVIGINVEEIERDRLLGFLDDYFITYPIYLSGPLTESELGEVPGLPTTFLVSPQGTVVAREIGGVTGEMIEKFIQKWEERQN